MSDKKVREVNWGKGILWYAIKMVLIVIVFILGGIIFTFIITPIGSIISIFIMIPMFHVMAMVRTLLTKKNLIWYDYLITILVPFGGLIYEHGIVPPKVK